MTHLVWCPPAWRAKARATLAGLLERHPARTIFLDPRRRRPRARIEASVELKDFELQGLSREVLSEVIELRLHGTAARHPASIVLPLLVSDLPVFCRWRGEPAWERERVRGDHRRRRPARRRLVRVADAHPPRTRGSRRSSGGSPSRTSPSRGRFRWRRRLAELWPGIALDREAARRGAAGGRGARRRLAALSPQARVALTRRNATEVTRDVGRRRARRRAGRAAERERPALRRARPVRPRPRLRGRGQGGAAAESAARLQRSSSPARRRTSSRRRGRQAARGSDSRRRRSPFAGRRPRWPRRPSSLPGVAVDVPHDHHRAAIGMCLHGGRAAGIRRGRCEPSRRRRRARGGHRRGRARAARPQPTCVPSSSTTSSGPRRRPPPVTCSAAPRRRQPDLGERRRSGSGRRRGRVRRGDAGRRLGEPLLAQAACTHRRDDRRRGRAPRATRRCRARGRARRPRRRARARRPRPSRRCR